MPIDFSHPDPLYKQIISHIKQQIANNEIVEDEQIGSHQELAKRYNVSLITIKKAIADLIKEDVLYSRVGKGTFVAKRKAEKDVSNFRSIGMVLLDLKNPFFSQIVHHVQDLAFEHDFNVLLSNSSGSPEREAAQIRRLRKVGVNGLIIASMEPTHTATKSIRRLKEENFPFVMVSYVKDNDIPFVGADNKYGAFLATEHLIKCGFKRIGYINATQRNVLGQLRKQGYLQALKEYNLPEDEKFVYEVPHQSGWARYKSGYDLGQVFLSLTERPQAIFAYNDLIALGFQQAILDQGLNVPEDVAIVGFDDIEASAVASVPLTTIHQPITRISRQAFELLNKQIDRQTISHRVIIKPELVVRESCGFVTKSQESLV